MAHTAERCMSLPDLWTEDPIRDTESHTLFQNFLEEQHKELIREAERQNPPQDMERWTPVSSYKPINHFESTLNMLQGVWSKACVKFDQSYMESLKNKLGSGDYSLENVHKHIPNKDRRYLNYIYYQLTGEKLYIDMDHKKVLKMRFNACYRECSKLGVRPCSLNILEVSLADLPAFDYIKPFIYTKFKLPNNIYDRLKDDLASETN